MDFQKPIRILGKGKTALSLHNKFVNSLLYDDSDFEKYDKSSNELTIVSPGIPPHNNMVLNSKNISSDYDLFSDEMPFSIWISGTNGKTTTTQMIEKLLSPYKCQAGGNIGLPICSMDTGKKIWILETSSYTLHYTNKARPNLYVLLPISEDHLTWHGSYEEYKKSKIKPVLSMKEGEIAIVPKEFANIKTNAHLITYENSSDLCSEFGINRDEIKFKEPFLLDSLLALATKKILFDEIDYKTINNFEIDEHKVEELNDKKNRLWINDSKGTNVDATVNALKAYSDKKIYLILGGDDKGVNLNPLFEYMKSINIKIFTIGSSSSKLVSLCNQYNIEVSPCEFLNTAVSKIDVELPFDGVAMLSPATSSFDQFPSYIVRGKEFKRFVSQLR